ncbi:hypothetical protein JOB18_046150 [Solea senegalensis]|uniref:Uncharacterized protein n=1 Tax=Solea senegalensis TaxID=28829 RepID=A0AAV6QEY0_SOLSE|nr:hypothetical protein JOB18_046150 [Solea senegalensis]
MSHQGQLPPNSAPWTAATANIVRCGYRFVNRVCLTLWGDPHRLKVDISIVCLIYEYQSRFFFELVDKLGDSGPSHQAMTTKKGGVRPACRYLKDLRSCGTRGGYISDGHDEQTKDRGGGSDRRRVAITVGSLVEPNLKLFWWKPILVQEIILSPFRSCVFSLSIETKYAVLPTLFYSVFDHVWGDPMWTDGPLVYSRFQLFVLRYTAVLPKEQPRCSTQAEEDATRGGCAEAQRSMRMLQSCSLIHN